MRKTNSPITIREYETISLGDNSDMEGLMEFAKDNQHDRKGKYDPVIRLQGDKLKARNYVGVIHTSSGQVLEILPKVDLGKRDSGGNRENTNAETRKIFLHMLRTWRNIKWKQFGEGDIRELMHFHMLEIFIRLFLENLVRLTKRGFAMNYQPVEENLPCLRGRIVFAEHILHNMANDAQFYVRYDELSTNIPVNRLIRSAIDKLIPLAHESINRHLLHQMRICFNAIPPSHNYRDDWNKHQIDRAIPHYLAVMQWVGLFLFGRGLATFSGKYASNCLLFPMEQIFEDYIAHAFRRYQEHYQVRTQATGKYLATANKSKQGVFQLHPDILIERGENIYVLDTKWKRINEKWNNTSEEWECMNEKHGNKAHGISQSDMYQLYAYGKKYKCRAVALIYPRTRCFGDKPQQFCYHFDNDPNTPLDLLCFPFDVSDPETSVKRILDTLEKEYEDT